MHIASPPCSNFEFFLGAVQPGSRASFGRFAYSVFPAAEGIGQSQNDTAAIQSGYSCLIFAVRSESGIFRRRISLSAGLRQAFLMINIDFKTFFC